MNLLIINNWTCFSPITPDLRFFFWGGGAFNDFIRESPNKQMMISLDTKAPVADFGWTRDL